MNRDELEPLGEPDIDPQGIKLAERSSDENSSSSVTALDRWLVRQLLAGVGNPPIQISLWTGECIGGDSVARERLHFRDREAMIQLALNPELHFGDMYSEGRITVEGDLIDFLETTYRRLDATPPGPLRRLTTHLSNRPHSNDMSGSRDNIHHHYDIGNDFYRLWLDTEAMQYTCAYYSDPAMSLEQAQEAKLHHVCRKLRLAPGMTVVEAGCGWGGLARFMARHYGVRVRAYNISHEQMVFARQRAEEEGLADRIEFVEDDYRTISGEFDAFVSVGMLEHVGVRQFPQLGEVINRCLKPRGRGLIHTIGRNQPGLMNAWIERRIFPGACPPSLGEMMQIFEPWGFSVQDVENLRMHYARTLHHWLDRFDDHAEEVRAMFDERFVRAWRLYLAGSIAAFTTGSLQLFQVMFERPQTNNLPWHRGHLYVDSARGTQA